MAIGNIVKSYSYNFDVFPGKSEICRDNMACGKKMIISDFNWRKAGNTRNQQDNMVCGMNCKKSDYNRLVAVKYSMRQDKTAS